jgi:hypothetical protein
MAPKRDIDWPGLAAGVALFAAVVIVLSLAHWAIYR